MSEPFIFIGTHALKQGKLRDYERYFRAFCLDVVAANEPQLIAFNGYASEDGTETSVVQVHPDADSMLFHMNLIRDHVEDVYDDLLDRTIGIDIYGTPTAPVLETITQLSGSGVPVRVKPLALGGFTRSAAASASAVS